MKNKISRRQFLQAAGASAAALLLASCSGNSASSVSSSSVASSTASSVAASSEAASSAAASSEATSTVTTTGKTLVVYFSATGTTQGVAQTIADTVGADLFEVVPSDPYTSDYFSKRTYSICFWNKQLEFIKVFHLVDIIPSHILIGTFIVCSS